MNELMQSDTRINAAAQKAARAFRRGRSTGSSSSSSSDNSSTIVAALPAVAQLRGHNHPSRCASIDAVSG